jgi:resuscitation-promoting factor RpfB
VTRIAVAAAVVLAACGTASDQPRHIVVSAGPTTTRPHTTVPNITAPPPTEPRPTTTKPSRAKPRPAAPVTGGDVWAALARCESGGNPAASTGNGYYGAFQFSLSTWRSVGGTGYPHQHSYAEQLHRAQMLQARSGWGQWPTCARKLGLIR